MRRLLAAVLVLSACGGDDGGTPGPDAAVADAAPLDAAAEPDAGADAGPVTTVGTFCHDLSAAICAGLTACGCRFDVRAYDEAGCVEARTAECSANLGPIAGEIAAGMSRFHEPSVAACLAATEAMAA